MGNEQRAMNGWWLDLSVVCWVLGAGVVHADSLHLIRYQGQAVDSQSVPLEGPYTLTFRLYDAETVGTKVWEEAQANVPLQGGHFSVLLGQVTPLNGMKRMRLSAGSRQTVTGLRGSTNLAWRNRNVRNCSSSSSVRPNSRLDSTVRSSRIRSGERSSRNFPSFSAVYTGEVTRPPVSALTKTFVSTTASSIPPLAHLSNDPGDILLFEAQRPYLPADLLADAIRFLGCDALGEPPLVFKAQLAEELLDLACVDVHLNSSHWTSTCR